MRLTLTASTLAALVAFVSAADNAFSSPLSDDVWAAGSSHRVTWADPVGETITLDLMEGTPDDLKVAVSIGSTENTGSIVWQIPSSVENGTYALRITVTDNSTDVNYSPWFIISNNNTAAIVSSSASGNSTSNGTAVSTSMSNSTSSSNSTATTSHNSTGSSTVTSSGSESSGSESSGSESGSKSGSSKASSTATATASGSSSSKSSNTSSGNSANIIGAGLAGLVGAAAMLL